MDIEFIYKDNEYTMKIVDIYKNDNNRKYYIKFVLNGNIYNKRSKSFLNLNFQDILKDANFKFKVGDIVKVNTGYIKIIENLRVESDTKISKACRYICLNDNVESISLEGNILKGQGCAVCTNHHVVKGVNDIATTHPEYIRYFLNIEDCYTYSHGSAKQIDSKCPFCGNISKSSPMIITQGRYICNKCNISSYKSERIMSYILEENNIKFFKQQIFAWSKNRRYDFYIPEFNMIIETNGEQHYRDTGFDIGCKKQKEIDILKKDMALNNGIENYIVIDCRKSNYKYILNSILNSSLKKYLNIIKFDIKDIILKCCSNEIKIASDIYNKTKDVKDVMVKLKVSKNTAYSYLNAGKNIGICDYKNKNDIKKTNLKKASNMWNSGIKNIKIISKELGVNISTARAYLKESNKMGITDYEYIIEKTPKTIPNKNKPVYCITTNEIFESQKKACEYYNIQEPSLSYAIKYKKSIGIHPKTNQPLFWERIK